MIYLGVVGLVGVVEFLSREVDGYYHIRHVDT